MATKPKQYTASQLNNMNVEQLIKVLNTQAERYNKQVTRAKKSGKWSQVLAANPNAQRFAIIKQKKLTDIKAMNAAAAEKALIKAYFYREKLARGGYTQSNTAKLEKKHKQNAQALGTTEDNAKQVYDDIENMASAAAVRSSMYYEEVLKKGVQYGVYNSYSIEDRPKVTVENFRADFIREQRKIAAHAKKYGYTYDAIPFDTLQEQIQKEFGDVGAMVQRLL